MKELPTRDENPDGLHQRYHIAKVSGSPIDPKAEYFVLRLDKHGKDPKHIDACRRALLTYAYAIRDHIPKLSRDLFARYGASATHEINVR